MKLLAMPQYSFRSSSWLFYMLALAILVGGPLLAFGSGKTLYVDQDASGKEDGFLCSSLP